MQETNDARQKFLWLLFSAYGLVALVLTVRHAMWRDELYFFSLGESSGSFLDLVKNQSTDYRPLGWTTISWVATKFVSSPDVLKYINWIFALGLGYTVLFRLPIRLLAKTSFMFGFLVLIGYSHIGPDYMLAFLLSALLVTVYLEQRPQYLVFIFAGLLANTHPLFWGISIGVVFLSLTMRFDLGNPEGFKWGKVRGSLGGLSLYLIALGVGVVSTTGTSDDAGSRIRIDLVVGAKRALRSVTLGLFPFITDNGSASPLFYAGTVIGIAVIGWLAFLAYKAGKYTAVGILLINSVTLGIVAFIKGDYWWHYGVVFVNFFLSAVILINSDQLQMKRRRHIRLLLQFVLCGQVIASFVGPRTTLWETQPYSNAKSTADFLRSECADDCTIISNSQVTGTGVSAYLGGRSIYYADKGDFGTFTVWSGPFYAADWDRVMTAAKKFDNPIIVVSDMGPPPSELVVIKSFTGAVWADEDFTVLRFAAQN